MPQQLYEQKKKFIANKDKIQTSLKELFSFSSNNDTIVNIFIGSDLQSMETKKLRATLMDSLRSEIINNTQLKIKDQILKSAIDRIAEEVSILTYGPGTIDQLREFIQSTDASEDLTNYLLRSMENEQIVSILYNGQPMNFVCWTENGIWVPIPAYSEDADGGVSKATLRELNQFLANTVRLVCPNKHKAQLVGPRGRKLPIGSFYSNTMLNENETRQVAISNGYQIEYYR